MKGWDNIIPAFFNNMFNLKERVKMFKCNKFRREKYEYIKIVNFLL